MTFPNWGTCTKSGNFLNSHGFQWYREFAYTLSLTVTQLGQNPHDFRHVLNQGLGRHRAQQILHLPGHHLSAKNKKQNVSPTIKGHAHPTASPTSKDIIPALRKRRTPNTNTRTHVVRTASYRTRIGGKLARPTGTTHLAYESRTGARAPPLPLGGERYPFSFSLFPFSTFCLCPGGFGVRPRER